MTPIRIIHHLILNGGATGPAPLASVKLMVGPTVKSSSVRGAVAATMQKW